MDDIRISGFLGVNNVEDPIGARSVKGQAWLSDETRNLDLDNGGTPSVRRGTVKRYSGTPRYQFTTRDRQRMLFVDGLSLKELHPDFTATTLAALTSTARMYWFEANGDIYYTNGADSGIVRGTTIMLWGLPLPPWPTVSTASATAGDLPAGTYQIVCQYRDNFGRLSGMRDAMTVYLSDNNALVIANIPQVPGWTTRVLLSEPDGDEVFVALETTETAELWNGPLLDLAQEAEVSGTRFFGLEALPEGATVTALHRGRAYAAVVYPDFTAVYPSQPALYHLFDLSDVIEIPGQVRGMLGTPYGLVIATDRAVYVRGDDRSLVAVAGYGVPEGWPLTMADMGSTVYVWTLRGLLEGSGNGWGNVTEQRLSVAPGEQAYSYVVEHDGFKQLMMLLQTGGVSYNRFLATVHARIIATLPMLEAALTIS